MTTRTTSSPTAGVEAVRSRRGLADLIAGRRTKYVVVVLWLAVVGLVSGLAGKLEQAQSTNPLDALPAEAESTAVQRVQASFAPPELLPAVVVYERSSGLTDADIAEVNADSQRFAKRTDLTGPVEPPVISEDRQAAQIIVPLNLALTSLAALDIKNAVDELLTVGRAGSAGMSVHVAGPAGSLSDQSNALSGISSTLLLVTIAVVVAILLVTYRSPILWLLPLFVTALALTVAQAVLYVMVDNSLLVLSEDGLAILTILLFGACTDYALLLTTRYREELRRHHDRHQAMAEALRRSGPAIVASAATVVAGLLCLLFAGTELIRGLGPVAAVGVLASLVGMLTLLPALLVIAGRWIFWPVRPAHGSPEPSQRGLWARLGRAVARRPGGIWIATTLLLGTMALGLGTLDATGLTTKEAFRGAQDSVAGEEILVRLFAGGAGSPVAVIAAPAEASAVRAALVATPGVDGDSVTEPVTRNGIAYIEGTLLDPANSDNALATVDLIRAHVHAIPNSDAKVGGESAIALDTRRAAERDRSVIIPIVLVVVLLILILLLRAVVAPLVLIATVVLSFMAALGTSAWVFRHVFGFAGEDPSLPLFVFVFLVALGVDYNIFLMTRVREETTRQGTRQGMLVALAVTGGVITSAGLALAGTFGALATLPLTVLTEIGFAVAFGVLLDAVVVRSILVPALTLHIGRLMWWPSNLSRGQRE